MDRFVVHEVAAGQRAIHALIIGVGAYPHLIGGSGALTGSHDGMGQLSSPPQSARAMADWLVSEIHHPDYPGRSVALLLSGDQPQSYQNPATGADHAVEAASYDNIATAISDWKIRGDAREDDLLVFYFCGHGISEGLSMILLPSDFGANPNNAYDTSLDFLGLYDAMAQCKARFQTFFVDACRASSDTLGRNNGRNPLQIGPRTHDLPRIAPVYYSTLRGDNAHGRPNQPSVYTEALIGALRDYAATDREGDNDWRVSTRTLADALDHLMERRKEAGDDLVQVPDSTEIHSPFYLCHLTRHPRANLYVISKPRARLAGAELTCRDDAAFEARRPCEPGEEWALAVPAGHIEVEAKLTGEPAPRPAEKSYANPPYKRMEIDLQ